MLKEKIVEATKPIVTQEALIELNKLKSFVDASLKDCFSQNFSEEKERTKYLLGVLYQIRDFVISRTIENSVRQSLILEFQKIEEEIELGNVLLEQKENQSMSPDDKQEHDQRA
jgi:hypothetical protein